MFLFKRTIESTQFIEDSWSKHYYFICIFLLRIHFLMPQLIAIYKHYWFLFDFAYADAVYPVAWNCLQLNFYELN